MWDESRGIRPAARPSEGERQGFLAAFERREAFLERAPSSDLPSRESS